MKIKLRFRWVLFSVGVSILTMAVAAPIASRADEAQDKDHPKLDGSIEQVLSQLSNRFHVHIDANWNELDSAGVSRQLSLVTFRLRRWKKAWSPLFQQPIFDCRMWHRQARYEFLPPFSMLDLPQLRPQVYRRTLPSPRLLMIPIPMKFSIA